MLKGRLSMFRFIILALGYSLFCIVNLGNSTHGHMMTTCQISA